MQIVLNGEPFLISGDHTLLALLKQAELIDKRIAVEVNQEIIPRAEHNKFMLNEGDCVEVIHAVGGG